MDNQSTVRIAKKSDWDAIDDFLSQAAAVHRHLDWRSPLEWLGQNTFLLVENRKGIAAILICTPEPTGIYWIRIFASINLSSIDSYWQRLFQQILDQLPTEPNRPIIASIAYHEWMINLMECNQWEVCQKVIQLKWIPVNLSKFVKAWPYGLILRPMEYSDLEIVARIDAECFEPLWQHSKDVLQRAYDQSSYATVATIDDEVVGFQISTLHKAIAHLARLSVTPNYQGKHIGQALVQDMLKHFRRPWTREITVNTQHNNEISLNLYSKMGFELTGESFPIYLYK